MVALNLMEILIIQRSVRMALIFFCLGPFVMLMTGLNVVEHVQEW